MRKRALHSSLIVLASLGALLSAAPAVAQPVAVNDAYAATEDTTLTIGTTTGVRANDNLAGLGNNADAIVLAPPTLGSLNLSQNGNFTYTPNANVNGTDTFTYRLRYPVNQFSNAATVTIVINAVNDAPTGVVNRSYATTQNTALSVPAPGVLSGVVDPDGPVTAALVTNVAPTAGTLSLNPTGAFTFTPAAGFSGNATFTYRAVDSGGGQSATATATITVSNVNDAPVANTDSYNTSEDIAAFNVAAPGVLGNDTDPDTGTVLTAVLVTSVPATAGTLTLNGNGSFAFRPALNFSGTTTFTYNARDNATPPASSAAPATVTINVTPVNDAPTAVADVFTTTENVPLAVAAPGLLANDTDPDLGTVLTAVLASLPSSGTLSPIINGGFTYTPASGFTGPVTFTYRAVDNGIPLLPSAAVATVTITVTGVNDPPVANADTYAATEDTVLNVAAPGVLANDTDPDPGTVLNAVVVAQPAHGTLTLSPNGSFSYSPAPDYQGADSFRYRARDNGTPPLQSGEATVTLNVASTNDAPRFVTGVVAIPPQTATQNLPFTLSLAPFFVDPEASPLTFTVTGLPAGLTFTSSGVISGTPSLTVTGPFSVNVVVSDGQSPFSAPPFTITVLAAGRTDLALSAAATPSPALINQPITWTFTVENRSAVENVANLSLQTVFIGPPSFAITPSARCVITPESARTTVACTAGPVLANGRATIIINGSSAQAGDVVATATVAITDAAPIDATPDNNTTTTVVNVAQVLAAGPAQTLAATGLRASASGDFNADGFVDLAVAAEAGGGTLIYTNVAVTTPPGSTKRELATQPVPLGDTGLSTGIAVADFNGDGALDLVVAKSAGPSVVLRNPNNGTFAFAVIANALGVATGASNAVAARDLNGDGRVDIVLGNSDGNRVFMNQANGTFTAGAALGNDNSRDVVLADLAGDAVLELVFANLNRGATVYSFNSATGQYQQTLWPTGATTSVAAADLDGNGRIDLVFGGPQSKVLLFNTAAAGAPPLFALPLELGNTATIDVLVTDSDADGDTDVVGINASGSHQVFANNGAGQFALRPQQFASRDSRNATAAKLSVDDRVDVAVIGASSLDVFHNDGAGNFGVGDAAAPTIQLRGEASVELTVESTYTDAGATATDAVDGDLTTRVRVDNPVNTAVVGTYTVTYNVSDNSGNIAAPVTRTVRVGVRAGTGGGGGGSFDLLWLLALAGFGVVAAVRPLANRRTVQ